MAREYEHLEQLLGSGKAVASGAEVHGFVAGWVAAGAKWSSAAGSFFETFEVELEGELEQAVKQLSATTEEQLKDVDFGFQLLLPSEQLSINTRRQALSDWCRGFLSGFGLTGRFQDSELSEEVKELLRDFGQIAQVEEEIPEDDDNESDLTEITEYVRMGAIMCFTDCASKAVH